MDSDRPDNTYEAGRLPMTDEELRIMEKNRRFTRRIGVPLMILMGGCGLLGGIWAIATDASAVGIGLAFSSMIMLGLGGYYFRETRTPVERPEKFFVTGVITKKKMSGDFTRRYYHIELNNNRYKCFLYAEEFKKLNVGDVVQCERLIETSVYADRVVILKKGKPPTG